MKKSFCYLKIKNPFIYQAPKSVNYFSELDYGIQLNQKEQCKMKLNEIFSNEAEFMNWLASNCYSCV